MPVEELAAGLESPIRLAQRNARMRTAAMERFLRRLGVSGVAYRRWTGGQSFGEFITANPMWSLRAWQCLIIENLELLKL
mgnify:CR=1 FL=1